MSSYKKSLIYRLLNVLYFGVYALIVVYLIVIAGLIVSSIREGSLSSWQVSLSVLSIPLIVALIVIFMEFARFVCLYLFWGVELGYYKRRLISFYEFFHGHRWKFVLIWVVVWISCVGISNNFFGQSVSSEFVSDSISTPTPTKTSNIVNRVKKCVVLRDESAERNSYPYLSYYGMTFSGIIENKCDISLPCPEIRVVVSSDPEGENLIDNSKTFKPMYTLQGGVVKRFSETVEYPNSMMEEKYYVDLVLDFDSVNESRGF